MTVNVDPATVVAFLGVVSTGLLGWFGYKRSQKADTVAEKAGAVEQIINGLNILVENLHELFLRRFLETRSKPQAAHSDGVTLQLFDLPWMNCRHRKPMIIRAVQGSQQRISY